MTVVVLLIVLVVLVIGAAAVVVLRRRGGVRRVGEGPRFLLRLHSNAVGRPITPTGILVGGAEFLVPHLWVASRFVRNYTLS